jgi:hypothetical protein
MNFLLEIRRLPLRAEILENVRLRHHKVDVSEIEEVVEVGGSTRGDDGKHPQIVAIIEHLRQLIGESHVGSRPLPASEADGPGILALFQFGVGAALLK